MAQQDRSTIKTFFETGDIPTEAQFGDSFDSQVFWVDDVETTLGNLDTKVPTSKAVNDAMVFTKDAENNVFYQGVTATLGTLCRRNIFYQASGASLGNGCQENVFYPRVSGITLGTGCIKNIFEGGNFTFANNLLNVVVKSSAGGGNDYSNLTNYGFMYNNTYSAIIFGNGTTNYHQYYDIANNRIVTTNLTTLAVVNISGGAGTVTSVNAGTNISVTGTAAAPIINSLSDRYKTTSTTSNTIGNGSRTFTVDANLSYIPLQEVLIVYDPSNHMHGEVTSYNSTTGQLIVDVKHHTGGPGPFTSWVINLDGVPIDAITGAGTANRLAYFTAAQVIDDLDTATYPSLTELSYVKGVTSAIQTQFTNINNRLANLIDIGTDGAATSGTSNTYSTGGLITPDQILAGDVIELYTIGRKSNVNGTITVRFYVNTTNDLSGSPILIGSGGANVAATRQSSLQRWLRIKVKNGTGAGTEVLNTSILNATENSGSFTSAPSTLAIDWTVNQYIIVAIQNGSSSDSSVSTMLKARR